MPFPKPIRYDRDTWLCMRQDPVLPKGIIRRVMVVDNETGHRIEKYRATTWDLDPAARMLIGYYDDLGSANESVLWEIRIPEVGLPPDLNPYPGQR
jgi:hypothetical protein